MPRSSPFVIRLSSAEKLELQRRADKYTLPYFQVQRAKMVLLAAEGLSNGEIAGRLDTRREVVGRWRKRFVLDRLMGLEEQARPGRPPDFFPQTSSSRLKRGLANCHLPTTFPCLAGAPRIWRGRSVRLVWWLPLVAAPFGVGCIRTLFGRGITAVGSFRATPNSLTKLDASWICTPADGKISP
jgi:hypothetical protein